MLLAASGAKAQSSSGWTVAADTLNVRISYRIASCSGNDRIFLKVENSSADAVQISWDDVLSSGQTTFTSGGLQMNRSLQLGAGAAAEGSCDQIMSGQRLLTLPVDLFLRGKDNYDLSKLIYTVSGFSKTTL